MTLLVAGTDITASLLAWALHLLGSHPNAEQRVHAELGTVLAGRSPTVADLPRLECLAQVLSETLRLYPPAWLLPRRAAINTTLGGHTIRRGSYVFYSPYLSHHDPLQFPDPDRFDPDRWLPERARDLSRYAHIPFGAGPHKCIGNSFSVIEAQTALATIMTRWRLRPSKNHPLRPHVFTSLTPGWLRMITERR
jgi:cyclooctat-9-en-7-ol 5-monooxygenase